MLWYKSWMETRWRFLIGLALLMCSAAATVLTYPQVVKLLPLAPKLDLGGEIGRRVAESMELSRSYRGYVWSQWFRQNMIQLWALFAVLLGTGGLLSQTSGGGTLFTLSLPVTRNRLLGIRAATGLAELLVLAVIPSLLLPLFSPAIGQTYGIGDALIHGACLFLAGAVLFSLAFLLSTLFSDLWRPPLVVLCIATAVALFEQIFPGFSHFGLFRVMSAEVYFRNGNLPWLGLFASAALSAAMLYAATRNIARQDF
jgi:ABC-type transport system involved in multi-copper enzyme maturation permease subunit